MGWGWLDFLRGGGDEPTRSQLQKAVKQVTQPHGDAAVRLEAFDRLKAWGTKEAMAALLRRFTIQTPSSQVDLDECQEVERMLVECGDSSVEPILRFLATESNVAYPARALRKILPEEKYVSEILGVLDKLDPSFGSREDQRSGLVRALEEVDDPRIADGLKRFLHDPSDDVALAALRCVTRSRDAAHRGLLVDVLVESRDRPRVREEIADRLADLGWPLQDDRKRVEECLPPDFGVDKKGRVVRLR